MHLNRSTAGFLEFASAFEAREPQTAHGSFVAAEHWETHGFQISGLSHLSRNRQYLTKKIIFASDSTGIGLLATEALGGGTLTQLPIIGRAGG
jgi:hypothetical protein